MFPLPDARAGDGVRAIANFPRNWYGALAERAGAVAAVCTAEIEEGWLTVPRLV
jgi:hypothetical protein